MTSIPIESLDRIFWRFAMTHVLRKFQFPLKRPSHLALIGAGSSDKKQFVPFPESMQTAEGVAEQIWRNRGL